ncbi:MAG: hypothetical protein V3V99_08550 [candidate division Zixibacteria bacterium]
MKFTRLFITVIILSITAAITFAGVPPYINYQGRLTNSEGFPVNDSTYTFRFQIYDAESGGDELWTSAPEIDAIAVTNGLYNYILGSSNPLPDSLAKYESLWLNITIDDIGEIGQRIHLTSVSYAFKALYADAAGTIADNVVDSNTILNSSISLNDIDSTGAGANQIIKRNPANTAWIFANDSISSNGLGGWNWSDSAGHGPDSVIYADSASQADYADSAGTVNAGDIRSGMLSNSRLSSNVSKLGQTIESGEITDEPGIARYYNDTTNYTVPFAWTTVGQQSINCPTPGYILAIGSATITIEHENGTGRHPLMGFSHAPNQDVYRPRSQFMLPENYPTGMVRIQMHNITFIPCSVSDTYTYYLNCVESSSGAEIEVSNVQVILLFFPTAYGTVSK